MINSLHTLYGRMVTTFLVMQSSTGSGTLGGVVPGHKCNINYDSLIAISKSRSPSRVFFFLISTSSLLLLIEL